MIDNIKKLVENRKKEILDQIKNQCLIIRLQLSNRYASDIISEVEEYLRQLAISKRYDLDKQREKKELSRNKAR